jgi:hypothetical protein
MAAAERGRVRGPTKSARLSDAVAMRVAPTGSTGAGWGGCARATGARPMEGRTAMPGRRRVQPPPHPRTAVFAGPGAGGRCWRLFISSYASCRSGSTGL